MITPDLQTRLWPYLGGIARENKIKALSIGGVEDHVHMLVGIPSTISISKAVQLIKGNSSKWIHETFINHRDFEWQEGYAAFGVSISGIDETIKYIENQTEHHRKKDFKEELRAFLKRHGLEFEDSMLD